MKTLINIIDLFAILLYFLALQTNKQTKGGPQNPSGGLRPLGAKQSNVKAPLNIIDLLAILPYFLAFLLEGFKVCLHSCPNSSIEYTHKVESIVTHTDTHEKIFIT